MPFSGWERSGYVVHGVVVFECCITESVFPMVIADATMMEGGKCGIEERVVDTFSEAVLSGHRGL